MDYWVQFAKAGDPNLKPNKEGRPQWPAYTVTQDQHLVMDASIVVDTGLRSDACDMLDEVLNVRRKESVATQ